MSNTPPLQFCLALHIHQPVGNFDSVFEQHLSEVYRPLITSLMDGELFPVALHLSGPLLEWLDDHAPDFVDVLGEHARAGRLELLCAGHDEPILAILSRQDRLEQVLRHREWIQRRLGVDARGLWLTERVWEPTMPGELAASGVDYVLVDDRHFRVTGFSEDELHAHFVTEAGGHRINVFPIDEKLRYLIPFRPPSELATYFDSLREAGHRVAVLGDDGEKFGGWPGTRKWLYDDGWLEDFLGTMRMLRDQGRVALTRFDDALRNTPSAGLAYLPSASYREMEGWSLPFDPARALLRLEADWGSERLQGVEGGLLRGGHWRHFLVKYPESNRMHKVMMALSALSRERGDRPDVRRAIGRAQCNDAYWHGVFGGLYLPFLRGAIWKNLAQAEALLRAGESLTCEAVDIDADGHEELWIHSGMQSLIVAPDRGGMIDSWCDLREKTNYLNVIARHREAYHEPLEVEARAHVADSDGAPSIHDLESQLSEIPPIDREPRGLFVDRVLRPSVTREDFINGTVTAIASMANHAMALDAATVNDAVRITFEGNGLKKKLEVRDPGSLDCEWAWSPDAFADDAWFSTELSMSDALDIDAPGAERWDYPIETVAKSEKGFERAEQGNAVVLRWPASVGRARVSVRPPIANPEAISAA